MKIKKLATSPSTYSFGLAVGYLMMGPSVPGIGDNGGAGLVGPTEACADGTCNPAPNKWCNIGGDDHQHHCKAGDDGCS